MGMWVISYEIYNRGIWKKFEHYVNAQSEGNAWNMFILENSNGTNIYDILSKNDKIIQFITEIYGYIKEYIPVDTGEKFKEFLDINNIDILTILNRCGCELDCFDAYYALTDSGFIRSNNRKRISNISIRTYRK